MRTAIFLLLIQCCFGAFDTLWYHEFRLRLPHDTTAQKELRLHASRDFAYAVIVSSVAWLSWNGSWSWALIGLLLAEVFITLWDFIQEDRTRKVPPGERVMHALMGIAYGAFLAYLLPEVIAWSKLPTGFMQKSYGVWSWALTAMAVGVFLSGIRDLMASIPRSVESKYFQRERA